MADEEEEEEEERASKRRKGKEIVPLEKTIKFKLYPAGFLKDSLDSLSDVEFNPVRIAMVEITGRGFQCTVRNEESDAMATIFIKSYELIDFRCAEPLFPHMMFLDQILSFLSNVGDDETVKVYHFVGSDQPRLFFKVKFDVLNVDLMRVVNANTPRFPYGVPDCSARISSKILNELIKHLKDKDHLVSVEVKRELMIISVRVDEQPDDWKRWTVCWGGVKTQWGMRHHARFSLPYLESLRKASFLDPDPLLCFLSQPKNHILMQFCFEGRGEVLFLLKAEMLDTTPDMDSLGSNTSDTSHPGGDASEASQPGNDAAEGAEPAFNRREGKEIADRAKTIKFKLIPARFLRISLESLNDSELNPHGLAMVEITDRGFQIMAQNEITSVVATLIFRPSDLMDFRCIRPLLPHMIFLDPIIDFLFDVPDDQIITIFHFDDSGDPQLFFKFKPEKSSPANELNVSLMDVGKANLQQFLQRLPVCTAPITSIVLKEMIQSLKRKPRLVSVEVKRDLVILSIGLDELPGNWERWQIDCANVKTQRGMKHHAMFKLPCLESMRIALSLDQNPIMYFESQPENHITVQFCPGLGEVHFLLKVEMLDMTPDMDSPDSDASEAPPPASDASGSSQPGGDAAEASQLDSGASRASWPGGSAFEASHAAEASQPHDGAAEASQPDGDAAAAS